MTRLSILSAPLIGLLLAATASASTLFGNPIVSVVLEGGPTVYVAAVDAASCPGNTTATVTADLTTSAPLSVSIPTGTWCGLRVRVRWSPGEAIDEVVVGGFASLQTVAGGAARTIALDPVARTATLD